MKRDAIETAVVLLLLAPGIAALFVVAFVYGAVGRSQ